MGNAYAEAAERKALEYVAELFSPYGLEMRREACSPIHETSLIHVSRQGLWSAKTLLHSGRLAVEITIRQRQVTTHGRIWVTPEGPWDHNQHILRMPGISPGKRPPGTDFFFFQAEDGIRDGTVTGVQTCALPI